MNTSELLSFLSIGTVDETKITDEALVLFIHLLRKAFVGVCHALVPF
ncbi:MAG: hypothetical protein NVS4B12_08110 [Ktedonobacteraceae bacterium]